MNTNPQTARRWGMLLFLLGFAAGIWLLGGIAWANLEASLFGSGDVGENLSGLRCSLLITPNETALAQVTLTNPLDRPIHRLVRWRIAQRHLLLAQEERQDVMIPAGGKTTVTQTLSPDQGVYGGRFLMTSAYVGSTYPLPALQGSCGTWIVHLPWLRGIHILLLGNLLAIGGMGLGFWLRHRHRPPQGSAEGALALSLITYLIGMGAVLLFRWWVIAGLAFFLMLLILIIWAFQRIDERWLQVKPPIDNL